MDVFHYSNRVITKSRYPVRSVGLVSTLVVSGQKKNQDPQHFVVNRGPGFRDETFLEIKTSRMIAMSHPTMNRMKMLTTRSD